MFNIRKQSLRFKIFSGFAFIFVSIGVFGLIISTSLGRVTVHFEEAQSFTQNQIEPLVSLQAKLLQSAMPVNDYLITGREAERARFYRAKEDIEADLKELELTAGTRKVLAKLRETENLWRSAGALGLKILDNDPVLKDSVMESNMERFDDLIVKTADKLKDAEMLRIKQVEIMMNKARAERRAANILIIIIWILTPTVSVISGLWLSKIVLTPISVLQQGARKIGKGDLDQKLDLKTGDEFEELAREFHVMAHRLKKNRDMLHTLAIHDGLTGLFNHREFHRLLRQEFERSKRSRDPLALLILDIDHFKNHNDSFGHKQGDKALMIIARLIKSQVRQIDISARYGGEEFAVILPGASIEEATSIAERIRVAVNTEPFIVTDQIIQISVSIGIAEYPVDANTPNSLIEAADLALYSAKKGGRDRICQRSI